MIKCKHCCNNIPLKSSVCNLTGQSYELQLTAYNAMTSHLRRVLSAKSTVKSGKLGSVFSKQTKQKIKKSLQSQETAEVPEESVSQNVIDRLAYDTKHHPYVVANMSHAYNEQCSEYYFSQKVNCSNSADSNEDLSPQVQHYMLKHHKNELHPRSADQRGNIQLLLPSERTHTSRSISQGIVKNTDNIEHVVNTVEKSNFIDINRFRNSEKLDKLKTCFTTVPCVMSNLEISYPGEKEFVISSMPNINYDRFCINHQPSPTSNSDTSKYVEFVYNITKEIIDRGYYCDRDIENVFEKHLKKNLATLDKEKMEEEINCLKRALNIIYDSKTHENDMTENCGSSLNSASSYSKLQNSIPTLDGITKIDDKK